VRVAIFMVVSSISYRLIGLLDRFINPESVL